MIGVAKPASPIYLKITNYHTLTTPTHYKYSIIIYIINERIVTLNGPNINDDDRE